MGSTYLVRFNDDSSTNIRGAFLHGTTHTVYLHVPPDTVSQCPFDARLFIVYDTTVNHSGHYARYGTSPLMDTLNADTLTITLPYGYQPNHCRLLLVDSSLNTGAVFTDTTDSIFHIGGDVVPNSGLKIPDHYDLSQNFPNPFNPTTEITYALPQAGRVTLTVFNLLGQKVATLVNGTEVAGIHAVSFDGRSLPSGIYFYHLQAGEFVQTRKMVLLK